MKKYLDSDHFFNQDHPKFEQFISKIRGGCDREKAVSIYYLVRDSVRYDPFSFLEGQKSLSSNFCLDHGRGYCIPKAALQVALSRSIGIPARIGLADVRNHLSSAKIDELLKNDIFTMHGYVEQLIDDKWVKSTPAFDSSLCDKVGIYPLEFDGIHNSIFHQFTPDGDEHMEYLEDHGHFAEMPLKFIKRNFNLHYPHIKLKFEGM